MGYAMPKVKKFHFNTEIPNLGKRKIKSPRQNKRFVDDSCFQTLIMTPEELAELEDDTLTMEFEKAGPREKLYFDPSKTKCAVVTCGGMCPGVNDVIRALVMEAPYSEFRMDFEDLSHSMAMMSWS